MMDSSQVGARKYAFSKEVNEDTVSSCATAIRSLKTDILMIKEGVEYLKVIARTLYRLAAAKKIPASKQGGIRRFSRSDADTWIRQQPVQGAT
jgi:excisionase family DNA binding protein